MYVRFAVPDLETVPFRVLKREADYEIREVEVIVVISFTFLFHFSLFKHRLEIVRVAKLEPNV